MQLSRRAFTGGAFGFALGSQLGTRALAQVPSGLGAAVAAIRAQAEAHHSFFGLPGLTLALATPDGFGTVREIRLSPRSPIWEVTRWYPPT